MSPVEDSAPQKDSFTFLSFLQCNRHSKSASRDSGLGGGEVGRNLKDKDVILISDDESNNEPEFEMLCEVEFDPSDELPMPIEQKFLIKSEAEGIQDANAAMDQNKLEQDSALGPLKDEIDLSLNLGECEDELLSLCRAEDDDNTLNNNNYILFICPQCGTDFDNCGNWKIHIDSAHDLSNQRTFNFTQRPNNKFQCNKCQTIITRCTVKTLQQHRFTHLPFKVYKCKLCRHEERSLYLMISHIMLHKDKEELDLIEIPSSVTTGLAVLEHESKQLIAYICPVCGISFDNEDTWQGHINFEHNFLEKTADNRFDDHFKCTECNVEIFSQHVFDLQKHLFTHLPFKSFLKCKICNWTISRNNFMISHILHLHKNHLKHVVTTQDAIAVASLGTPASKSTCEDTENLPESVSSVFNYDDDERNDEDDAATQTVINNKSNDTNGTMASPAATTQDKPTERRTTYRKQGFRCSRCDSHFPTAAERNAHNVAQHGKYVCRDCQRNFAIKVDWKRHCCRKNENKTLQCPFCRREYNYEKCLQKHLRYCVKKNKCDV